MPHDVDIGLLLSALPLCLLSRAANIFPLAAVANKLRSTPIPFNMQIMQWLCGLRGAIAYALVINLPHSDTHVSTPMAVTLICLLKCLHDGVSWAERIAISLALYITLRGYAMLPPTRVWRKTGFALARRLETVQQLLVQQASRHPAHRD
jgi:hypothetical protein